MTMYILFTAEPCGMLQLHLLSLQLFVLLEIKIALFFVHFVFYIPITNSSSKFW